MQEKERFFHTELVKACVPYHQAAKAARIIASEHPNEQMPEEEIQLVNQVCRQWLEQRQRWKVISQIVDKASTR